MIQSDKEKINLMSEIRVQPAHQLGCVNLLSATKLPSTVTLRPNRCNKENCILTCVSCVLGFLWNVFLSCYHSSYPVLKMRVVSECSVKNKTNKDPVLTWLWILNFFCSLTCSLIVTPFIFTHIHGFV